MGQYYKNNIKMYREQNNYTQQQVADILGVDKSQISRYENGEQAPRNENMASLARIFKVSLDELLGVSGRKYDVNKEGIPVIDVTEGEVVRRQFFSRAGDRAVTITPNGIRLSTACIRQWEDVEYVNFVVLKGLKLLIVRKSSDENIDAQRWKTVKNGKSFGRKITGSGFAGEIYKLMDWCKGYSFHISGYLSLNKYDESETMWFFDLEEAEAYPMGSRARRKAGVREEEIDPEQLDALNRVEDAREQEKILRDQLKQEGKDPGPAVKYVCYPDRWGQYTFGLPVKEYGKKPSVGLSPPNLNRP